ncbi:hypothetical protein RND71_023120 [Anisodus tanguticus]|uniref:NB-ARC domain-containing protein n=1 Tax=Anisodus tanguticus TaxID=243964 RepID=A0AAE1RTT8_9SOLA|nr:hypothetical protein RND71_023120 [Anisodus tanguticus]
MNILEHKPTLKAQILDLIENAHEEIVFLRAFLMDVLTQHTYLNKLHDLLMHAEVSAHKLAQISGSCYGCFTDGSSTEKMRLWLSHLLQEIEYCTTSRYASRTQRPHEMSSRCKHQIESVKEAFLCLRSLTGHFSESYDENDEVYNLITSVVEMAYKAEYVTDSCLTLSHPLWYKVLWMSEVVENIKLVIKIVSETCERKKLDETVPEVAKTSTTILPSLFANTPRENEKMEGFQDETNLDVISVVGMPGISKTTLAEKIYNDAVVTSHFDVRSQCCVTQIYLWRDLLITILNGVLEPVDRNEKEDGELTDELRRFLLTKRFLVLIDDVWDTKVWENFHMCFRDAQNRSRIILTTRLRNVASYAQCESEPHHLRLFGDDESWTLLQKEVFQGESCPSELVDVGFRIAKCCGGFPLFIVLVAGVLKEKKKKAELWKEIEV